MLKQLLNVLMIATVLICPALGGRCCESRETRRSVETENNMACEHCCCHHESASLPVEPESEECPGECQDCFCAGALPVGPSAIEALPDKWSVSEYLVPTSAKTLTSLHRASLRFDVRSSPPTTGERLAILCTLLI